ncbi:hypothetical protein K1T71_001684 [Dendrolimus kikuchii]|uniref:Uncharacterized protein n=1 Tax=Dendrolimus kikuchii TaxID=765133 RepID=A0ACC1DES8_9NEOP|nr:hypothetical protein K1T71_001684 [Dendrolimus kikuchii]
MEGERKIHISEGVPLNASGAANIFLNTGTGKESKQKSNDGTVIHLKTEKPSDLGVHINTTFSIASSKKIRFLFLLNFLLSVICMVISCSIAFYYWNEMISMRRQLDSLKDHFLVYNLNQDKPVQSALVSQSRPQAEREPKTNTGISDEIAQNAKRFYVEDLGEDMLLVDSKKKNHSEDKTMVYDLSILQKELVVAQFNGGMEELNMGKESVIGPWVLDTDTSSKNSGEKIQLSNTRNYVTIKESGLYLVYAQIVYLTKAPNCFFIWASQTGKVERLLATCATGSDSSTRHLSRSQISCSVSTVARLYENDIVNLAQREHNRTLIVELLIKPLKTMLTRLKFRNDFRLFTRCLSDKPFDNDGKVPEVKSQDEEKRNKASDASKEKIQELLKSMLAEPKISESEYRAKFSSAPDLSQRRKKKDELEVKTETIEESITKAATDVAQTLGGDVKQTEAELLSRVLGKINQTSTTLSDLLIGMKIDRTKETDDVLQKETRGQQVKRIFSKAQTELPRSKYVPRQVRTDTSQESTGKRTAPQTTSVNIFSGEPLGIFKAREPNYGTTLDVWDSLKEREVTLATTQPPANYFQKMILWTEQGKIWKFPIDNEQGLEEEKKVHFSEHVFLDSYLEGWCPKRGPIRHFMELVCVGLSKNAFYTVQEKKDHIIWYKEYFETKKDLLNEVGAWDSKPNTGETIAPK